MAHVGKIIATITTGDLERAGTNGRVYLGIGGREFKINKPGNQFEKGIVDVFIIGDNSNIENPDDVHNLPISGGIDSPKIEFDNISNYPVYIRFEPQSNNDNWNVAKAKVEVIEYDDELNTPTYNKKVYFDLDGNIWLGRRSGLFLYLAQMECFNPKVAYDPSQVYLFPIQYLEYSAGNIKGDVYYPTGEGQFPIIFIAHGNHGKYYNPANRNQESCTQSPGWLEIPNHKGYDYFQKQLAGMGIIAVSVDCNSTNCKAYGIINIEERADLIIGSVDHFRGLNNDTNSLFFNRINFQSAGLMGHSRGGDAVVLVPERMTFTDVNIKCVISLAPTYTGASSGQPQGYVFMTILPAGDGDVWTNVGARFYDKAIPSPLKSQVYVHYTNHNYFNRQWPRDDSQGMSDNPPVMSRSDHEQILSAYGSAVFRYSLLNHNYVVKFLTMYAIPNNVNYENIHLSFQYSDSLIVDNHEDNNTINSNSLNLPTTQTGSITANEYYFEQGLGSFNNSFYGDSIGMVSSDTGINGIFRSQLQQNTNLEEKEIWLRAAEVYNLQGQLPFGKTGFQLGLEDNNGIQVWVDSDEVWSLPRPYFRGVSTTKTMLRTLRFSSHCFVNKNSDLNIKDIRSILIQTNRGDNRSLAFDELEIIDILK